MAEEAVRQDYEIATEGMDNEDKSYNNSLSQLLKYLDKDNICKELEEDTISEIGQQVCRDFETDESSREEWLQKNKDAIELAKQIEKEKTYPWPDASNVKFPILTTAIIQFNARAYPRIVQGKDVVKGVVEDQQQDQQQQDQQQPEQMQQGMMQPGQQQEPDIGEKIADHLNYQLLYEMEEWEEDTDKLLINLPLVGNVYRKTYYSPFLGRNISEMVTAENLSYNYNAPSFERAPRHTHCLKLYPREIQERQQMEIYRDVELNMEATNANDSEEPQEILEQHTFLDLDEDDYKEPYIVTVHRHSKEVLRIVPRFDREDITIKYKGSYRTISSIEQEYNQQVMATMQQAIQYEAQAQMMMQQGVEEPPEFNLEQMLPKEPSFKRAKIGKIEPTLYFTKYTFIPSLDGGSYDIGFGWLLSSLSHTIDTVINQMLDAGTLQNAGGGFIDKHLQISKGEQKFQPGEFKTVEAPTGQRIQDHIYQLQHPGPSSVLFQLLGSLMEAAKDITSTKDTLTGESGPAQESASRYMARLEQGMATFNAIFKRIHRSLKKEFTRLYKLNQNYAPKEITFQWKGKTINLTLDDYQQSNVKIVPVSDPSVTSQAQDLSKAEGLFQFFNGDPFVDQYGLRKRVIEAMQVENMDELLPDKQVLQQQMAQQQQQPDPEQLKAQAEAEKIMAETEKIRAETQTELSQKYKYSADAIHALAKAEAEDDKVALEQYRAELDALKTGIQELRQDEKDEQERIRGQSANSGRTRNVEGQPNNT